MNDLRDQALAAVGAEAAKQVPSSADAQLRALYATLVALEATIGSAKAQVAALIGPAPQAAVQDGQCDHRRAARVSTMGGGALVCPPPPDGCGQEIQVNG